MILVLGPGLTRPLPAAPQSQLWASNNLTKVLRDATPMPAGPSAAQLSGGRGEVVSGQAVFRAAADAAAATVQITDLHHAAGGPDIPRQAVQLQWVRYIDIDRNSDGLPADELVAQAPNSIPDPFWEGDSVAVKAHQAQPVWIEVAVPPDAAPGDYAGLLIVQVAQEGYSLPVALRVWDFEMPAERHLSVINWGVFPGQMYRESPAEDSDEYFRLYRDYCAFLVKHRQTDVMGAIDWIAPTRDDAGGVTYDTSRLERQAETAFAAGMRQIHLHAVGEKTASILDPVGRVAVPQGDPGPNRVRQLQALEQMIQRRNWQHRFLVAITDEPFIHHEESFAAAVELVHQAAPSVRVVEAVETEYLGKLDVCVPKLSHLNLWFPHFERMRQEQGGELWFYTCCHPVGRYPNRFLDQTLLQTRVLHWINYLYALQGYLHWGLNWYGTDDPYSQEGISKDLPLGDRAILYPGQQGLIGSLRFSAQRDGLQDFEYLWMLEDRLRAIKQQTGQDAFWLDPRQRPLELCRRVIWSFHDYTRDPGVLLETRRAVAEEIESLAAAPRLIVQTSPPEGTPIPAGPRMVNVRGLAPPGATVLLNGTAVANVRPSGYFAHYCFLGENPVMTVTVEHAGRRRSVTRTFKLVE